MSPLKYTKPERIWLKNHPEFTEAWLQDRIGEDPSLLGLGDLILKDKERPQPRAGRLDLLLQDAESTKRYEVELQLGKTDEAHIIRTIEYWDVERRRYPQYEHAAVIVAEDITSRFLNVIGLFNGNIPLIAIQLSAWRHGDSVSLIFTKVLDEVSLGLVGDDEEVQAVTDRAYWEQRGSKATLKMMDEAFQLLRELDAALELKYNKFYVGLAKDGQASNFVVFRPQKNALRVEIKIERSDETQAVIDDAGLEVLDYQARWGQYRIRLAPGDVQKHQQVLSDLFAKAYARVS